jgi:transposase
MPWTDTARAEYVRPSRRYASDLTDREWGLIAPLLPKPRPIGRPRMVDLREVMNAIFYIASAGCPRRFLPKDFLPLSTVQRYFYDWRDGGLLRTINNHLVMEAGELEGREASPTAGGRECPEFRSSRVRMNGRFRRRSQPVGKQAVFTYQKA